MNLRTQNMVAQSRWALPLTAIYAILIGILAGIQNHHIWLQIPTLTVATLLMVELNNSHSLIRIYSRMVSCSFLAMCTLAVNILTVFQPGLTLLLFVLFYLYLFRSYQNKYDSPSVFVAFCAIGLISIYFIQIIYIVPIIWILMSTNILALSFRTFVASLLGLIMPYWFVGALYLYQQRLDQLWNHLQGIYDISHLFDFSAVDSQRMVIYVFIVTMAIIGSLHFLRFSYKDKIRTRMIYEALITIDSIVFSLIIVFPQYFDQFICIAIATTAPLIGHYLALSNSKLSNICFYIIVLLTIIITNLNLWIPSYTF